MDGVDGKYTRITNIDDVPAYIKRVKVGLQSKAYLMFRSTARVKPSWYIMVYGDGEIKRSLVGVIVPDGASSNLPPKTNWRVVGKKDISGLALRY